MIIVHSQQCGGGLSMPACYLTPVCVLCLCLCSLHWRSNLSPASERKMDRLSFLLKLWPHVHSFWFRDFRIWNIVPCVWVIGVSEHSFIARGRGFPGLLWMFQAHHWDWLCRKLGQQRIPWHEHFCRAESHCRCLIQSKELFVLIQRTPQWLVCCYPVSEGLGLLQAVFWSAP